MRSTWIVLRTYVWSLVISMLLVSMIGAIASIPHCSAVWGLLLPGAMLAAIVFPEGVNSYGGNAYLIVAGLWDIVMLAFPVMLSWKLIERRRKVRG